MKPLAHRARLPRRFSKLILCFLLFALTVSGCSVRKMAIRSLAGSFDSGLDAYTRDGDPEFVREAMPATLKMVEVLIAESPENVSLLTAAASGFTMYSHAFLVQQADRVELKDLERARALRERGKQMYLRAREYGLRALEVRYPGFRSGLQADPQQTVERTGAGDIPLLYWTAASDIWSTK